MADKTKAPALRDDPTPIPLVRNNNAIYSLMATALANMKGGADIVTESLADFVDGGTAYSAIEEIGQDQFYKALIAAGVKRVYTDEAFIDDYDDPFYLDSAEYGGILAHIHAEAPAVTASHAWNTFVSGTTQLGTYTIYTCLVSEKLFGLSSSYELPIALDDEQCKMAFDSEESLREFTAYLMITVQNALKMHRKDQSAMNRANWIAEKIAYAASVGAKGIHVINLLEQYRTETGDTSITTAEQFNSTNACLRFAAACMDEYMGYLKEQTKMFNVGENTRFIPRDRLVCQVNAKWQKKVESVSYSDAYNIDYVRLPYFQPISCWQGMGAGAAWDDVTAIDVTTSGGNSVKQSGIVAIMVDKYAIAHTIKSQRVAVTRFDPEAVTQYYYQFRDSYINDLSLNGLVFVVQDHSA